MIIGGWCVDRLRLPSFLDTIPLRFRPVVSAGSGGGGGFIGFRGVGEGVAQAGGVAVPGEHPDQVVAADLAGGQGARHAEHVAPVGADAIQADRVLGDLLERAVVSGGVDPPQPSKQTSPHYRLQFSRPSTEL
jgi:hypothetical protein